MMKLQAIKEQSFYIKHSCRERGGEKEEERTIKNIFLNKNYKFYIFL